MWERSDRREQAEYRELKREQNLQVQLEALATKGAIQVERFEAYSARAETNFHRAQQAVGGMRAVSHQVAYLREQIELRALGLGWSDLATTWKQGDESGEQSVQRLLRHLHFVLDEESERAIPVEPPLPDFKAKSFTLGYGHQ